MQQHRIRLNLMRLKLKARREARILDLMLGTARPPGAPTTGEKRPGSRC